MNSRSGASFLLTVSAPGTSGKLKALLSDLMKSDLKLRIKLGREVVAVRELSFQQRDW